MFKSDQVNRVQKRLEISIGDLAFQGRKLLTTQKGLLSAKGNFHVYKFERHAASKESKSHAVTSNFINQALYRARFLLPNTRLAVVGGMPLQSINYCTTAFYGVGVFLDLQGSQSFNLDPFENCKAAVNPSYRRIVIKDDSHITEILGDGLKNIFGEFHTRREQNDLTIRLLFRQFELTLSLQRCMPLRNPNCNADSQYRADSLNPSSGNVRVHCREQGEDQYCSPQQNNNAHAGLQ